jgi:Calcineurin-like phosphoesterase
LKILGWTAALVILLTLPAWPGGAVDSLPTRFPDAPRIVAVGDLHGDLRATRRALKLAGAIDDEGHWIGGKLVLVQTGDQLDRGDDEQAILDLFVRLADEAARAGGAVHVLNGNHEVMNAAFDFRYTTPGGYRDFEDAVPVTEPDSLLRTFDPSQRARVAAFRPGGPYARVLAKWNTIVIIGPNVFAHGGILPEYVDYGIERLNAEVRAWLAGDGPYPATIESRRSPVWSRLYSSDTTGAACDTLTEVLDRLSVKRMIVGHTIQEYGITSHCDGKVWCIDAGMAAAYGSNTPQVLEIMGDSIRVRREN